MPGPTGDVQALPSPRCTLALGFCSRAGLLYPRVVGPWEGGRWGWKGDGMGPLHTCDFYCFPLNRKAIGGTQTRTLSTSAFEVLNSYIKQANSSIQYTVQREARNPQE